jgi:hypothetical protein
MISRRSGRQDARDQEDARQAKFNNYGEFFNTLPKNNLNTGAQVPASDSFRPSMCTAIQVQLG